MAEDEKIAQRPSQSFSYSQLAFNIVSALTIAFFGYMASGLFSYFLTSKADVYLVDSPKIGADFLKLILIDNYSNNNITKLSFTIRASKIQINSTMNVGTADATSVNPSEFLITIGGIFPNRQAIIAIASASYVEDANFTFVERPTGASFSKKSQLRDSFFEPDRLFSAAIVFVIYLIGATYLDGKMRTLWNETSKLSEASESSSAKMRTQINQIEDQLARSRVVYLKRIVNLSRENDVWRELIVQALKTSINEALNAQKIVSLFLQKLGVAPVKPLKQMEEDEMIELIQSAEVRLSPTAPRDSG
jgi:hypothetical protein